jgi:steroid 5-alpha reductase family enzyme
MILELALVVFVYMTLWYFLALYLRDNSVVDIAWGIGFILIAFWTFFRNESFGLQQGVVLLLVCLWGIRLSGHILLRRHGHGEDPRYAAWRKQWTWIKVRSFFQVFMLQGVIMLIIALPIIMVMQAPSSSFGWLQMMGVFIWLGGLGFESIADWQLYSFKKNPRNKGKILDKGAWKFSRHPNYFGEAMLWWGLCYTAFQVSYWWIIISPALITFFLLKVSGVTLLEARYKGNTVYDRYKRRTSSFIPWWPKNS